MRPSRAAHAQERHPEDLPFSVVAAGPAGWTVTAQVGSQAQAASVVVKAGSSSTVSVSAKPRGRDRRRYLSDHGRRDGWRRSRRIADLSVEITGSYKLALSTSDQRLNMSGTAGSVSDITLTSTNSGTADIEGAAMSATAPTGWKTDFDTRPSRSRPARRSTSSPT